MNNLLTFLLWLLLLIYLNLVPPTSFVAILGFMILVFAATLGTTRIFFQKYKLNLVLATIVVAVLTYLLDTN
jgi:hypothetical protein